MSCRGGEEAARERHGDERIVGRNGLILVNIRSKIKSRLIWAARRARVWRMSVVQRIPQKQHRKSVRFIVDKVEFGGLPERCWILLLMRDHEHNMS